MKKIFIPIFVLILSACNVNKTVSHKDIINTFGEYTLPDGSYELNVKTGKGSLIEYVITENATSKKYQPDRLFSDAMRWYFYWENDSRLWVHSSDIGLSLWKKDSGGVFKQVWANSDGKLNSQIPDEVYNHLPNMLKQRVKRN